MINLLYDNPGQYSNYLIVNLKAVIKKFAFLKEIKIDENIAENLKNHIICSFSGKDLYL